MREILENLSVGLRSNASLTSKELLFLEKAVFAESLVNSLTLLHQRQSFRAAIHDTYRENVSNHFSEGIYRTVRQMMEIIDPEIDDIFQILKTANALNRRKYMDYAKDISFKYADEDFEPRKFLYFCVHVTKLAMNFYSEGVREAYEYAFQAVLHALRSCDIDRIGWNSFKFLAEGYSPSPEAIANRSCVTTVCDTVPMLDNVQVNQMTSDEASSSEDTEFSSDEEDLLFLPKRPRLSPIGEAANTYLFSFASQISGPAADQQSSSVHASFLHRNSVPTSDRAQQLQVTSNEASFSEEATFIPSRPSLSLAGEAGDNYSLPLANQIVRRAADQQSSSELSLESSDTSENESYMSDSSSPSLKKQV